MHSREDVECKEAQEGTNGQSEVDALRARINDLEFRLKESEEKVERYLTQLKYLQADFENYRKRFDNEVNRRVASEKERILNSLITVKEDMERAMQARNSEASVLLQGLKIVYDNLKALLTREGVREIDALGAKFDPNLHEALSYVSREDCEDGIITAVIRPGYTLNGKVLRASLVEINKRQIPSPGEERNK